MGMNRQRGAVGLLEASLLLIVVAFAAIFMARMMQDMERETQYRVAGTELAYFAQGVSGWVLHESAVQPVVDRIVQPGDTDFLGGAPDSADWLREDTCPIAGLVPAPPAGGPGGFVPCSQPQQLLGQDVITTVAVGAVGDPNAGVITAVTTLVLDEDVWGDQRGMEYVAARIVAEANAKRRVSSTNVRVVANVTPNAAQGTPNALLDPAEFGRITVIVQSSFDPEIWLRLDGTLPMEGNLNMDSFDILDAEIIEADGLAAREWIFSGGTITADGDLTVGGDALIRGRALVQDELRVVGPDGIFAENVTLIGDDRTSLGELPSLSDAVYYSAVITNNNETVPQPVCPAGKVPRITGSSLSSIPSTGVAACTSDHLPRLVGGEWITVDLVGTDWVPTLFLLTTDGWRAATCESTMSIVTKCQTP